MGIPQKQDFYIDWSTRRLMSSFDIDPEEVQKEINYTKKGLQEEYRVLKELRK